MRYYISDLHFYHKNIINLDGRQFNDIDDMHEYMINQWNKKVKDTDEVIVLGDISFRRGPQTNEILNKLNGKICLVEGNHDHTYLQDKNFDRSRLSWVRPYSELNDNGRKVILSHYPIFCYNGQYRRDEDGNPTTYMLYGHVHNTHDEDLINQFIQITKQFKKQSSYDTEPQDIPCQMINCFCLYSDYTPLTLDEWIEVDRKRRNI